jgi:hypothetical protein
MNLMVFQKQVQALFADLILTNQVEKLFALLLLHAGFCMML